MDIFNFRALREKEGVKMRELLMTIAVSLLVFVFVIQLAELWCELSVGGTTEEEAEDER